jgi:hypothetical protein
VAVRTLGEEHPRLRVWTAPDWPVGTPEPGSIAVEWRGGQHGHGSSHFLVGGHLAEEAGIVLGSHGRFRGSVLGRSDPVTLGLDGHLREAIERSLERSGVAMRVTIVGSSDLCTSALTTSVGTLMVASLLTHGVPDDDAELWQRQRDSYAPAKAALEGWRG